MPSFSCVFCISMEDTIASMHSFRTSQAPLLSLLGYTVYLLGQVIVAAAVADHCAAQGCWRLLLGLARV